MADGCCDKKIYGSFDVCEENLRMLNERLHHRGQRGKHVQNKKQVEGVLIEQSVCVIRIKCKITLELIAHLFQERRIKSV